MKILDYFTLVILFAIFMLAASCSKDPVVDPIIEIDDTVEETVGFEDGRYGLVYLSPSSYDNLLVDFFVSNFLDFNPTAVLEVKDSTSIDMYQYQKINEFWDIDTEKKALKADFMRRIASPEHIFDQYTNDSLPYIKSFEVVNEKVVKLKIRNPGQNRTDYVAGLKLEGDDAELFIEDYYSETGFMADPIYSKIDPFDFYSFLDAFIEDAERHGVDLSHVDKSRAKFTLDPNTTDIAYVSSSLCDREVTEVYYQAKLWPIQDVYDKQAFKIAVMWHEFGHDLLQLSHINAGGHIMYGPNSSPMGEPNGCTTAMYDLEPYRDAERCINWYDAVSDMFNMVEQHKLCQ